MPNTKHNTFKWQKSLSIVLPYQRWKTLSYLGAFIQEAEIDNDIIPIKWWVAEIENCFQILVQLEGFDKGNVNDMVTELALCCYCASAECGQLKTDIFNS